MCELCELKEKADKARERYSFRIMQMQMAGPMKRRRLRKLRSPSASMPLKNMPKKC